MTGTIIQDDPRRDPKDHKTVLDIEASEILEDDADDDDAIVDDIEDDEPGTPDGAL